MTDTPRCNKLVYQPRSLRMPQCRNKPTVERDGIWWCSTHDPERIKARDAREKQVRDEKEQRDAAIIAEGNRLAVALGVDAKVYRAWSWVGRETATCEALVLTFDDVRALLARLK